MTLTPNSTQQDALTFFADRRRGILYVPMRAGKTIASLLIARQKGCTEITVVSTLSAQARFKTDAKHFPEMTLTYMTIAGLSRGQRPPTPDAVIIDEVHQIKSGKGAEALDCIVAPDIPVILLTGTPVNNLAGKDCFALLRFCRDPSVCDYPFDQARWRFLRQYCYEGRKNVGFKGGMAIRSIDDFSGPKDAERQAQIAALVLPHFFVGKMPEGYHRPTLRYLTKSVYLTEEQKRDYDSAYRDYRRETDTEHTEESRGVAFLKSLQVLEMCKAQLSLPFIKELLQKGAVVVAVQFDATRTYLAEQLDGVAYHKAEDIGMWESQGGALVISHRKGNTGTDLSFASALVVVGLPHEIGNLEQTYARLSGHTQKKREVAIYTVIAPYTVDGYLRHRHKQKRLMRKAILPQKPA